MTQVGHTGVVSTYIMFSFSLVSHSLITSDVIGYALIITRSLKSQIIVSYFKIKNVKMPKLCIIMLYFYRIIHFPSGKLKHNW